jgi:Family of unknown function (DUF6297)
MSTGSMIGPHAERDQEWTGRQARGWVSEGTRRRSGRGVGDALIDLYTMAFAIGLSIVVVNGSTSGLRDALRAGPGHPVHVDPRVSGAALLLLAAAVLLLVASRLGPISLGRAAVLWWLPLPADRPGLVGPALLARLVTGALVGGVVALVVLLVDPARTLSGVAGGAVVGACVGTVVVALAAVLQSYAFETAASAEAGRLLRRSAVVAECLALAAPVLLAGVAAGASSVLLTGLPSGWPVLTARGAIWPLPVAAICAAASATWAWRRRRHLGRALLAWAAAVGEHAAVSAVSMDTRELGRSMAPPVRQRRAGSRRMTLVARPWSVVPVADAMLLLRQPRRLVFAAVLAAVPVMAVLVVGAVPLVVGAELLVAGYAAATALGEGLRQLQLNPALSRLVPLSARADTGLRLVVPGAVMLLWGGVAVPVAVVFAGLAPRDAAVILEWVGLGLGAGLALAAGGARGALRPQPDFSGPAVDYGMGPVPVVSALSVVKGPDLAVIALLPTWIALLTDRPTLGLVAAQVLAALLAAALMVGLAGRRPREPRPALGSGR